MLGTRLVRFVPQHALQRAFAVFLQGMGGFILYQNHGVLHLRARPGPESTVTATH